MTSWRVLAGDCLDVLVDMADDSVDAVVTDPPYGIGFMGHEWDQPGDHGPVSAGHGGCNVSYGGQPHPAMEAARYDLSRTANGRFQAWCEAWATEALRVLKPGGHAVVFGGARTYHRLTCGLEDAGFEIRDSLMWLFGSGFPKSLDVSKAIDKAAGAEREIIGHYTVPADSDAGNAGEILRSVSSCDGINAPTAGRNGTAITKSATPEAEQWDGWGTALKPGYEPIVLARKPLAGTVVANVTTRGTGALNIDGCRIAGDVPHTQGGLTSGGIMGGSVPRARRAPFVPAGGGRWPANVVLDEHAAAMLDDRSGELVSGDGNVRRDRGGASRFFYCAKADSAERNAGLSVVSLFTPSDAPECNNHPTVKPIDLMRWLVRLVTPPRGTVLDPFTGSGTTGVACALEGFDFLGIERDDASVKIARARLAHWSSSREAA